MRKCILCANRSFKHLITEKNINIYECERCQLGITSATAQKTKQLYRANGPYNFKKYVQQEEKQIEKFNIVITLLRVFQEDGSILEVGSGYGLFAKLLHESNGFDITALEPNLPVHYLQKNKSDRIQIIKKKYEDFLTRKNKKLYDVVVFLDTLEHFENPLEILKKTRSILKPKGKVIILLPNYKSIMSRLSSQWPWWMAEDHTYHFSQVSLKKLIHKSNFSLQYLTSFENIVDFKKSLDGNFSSIDNNFIRKVAKGFSLFPLLGFYLIVRKLLWKFQYGGLLLAVGERT